MGTLGKALGTFGAYVAGSRALVDLLVNAARSFVFTTALPPPAVAAASAAVTVLQTEPQRRQQLAAQRLTPVARPARRGAARSARRRDTSFRCMVGDAERTMRWSEALLAANVFAQGIRPPTVPPGTARLRVTVMSTHTAADLGAAVAAFRQVCLPGGA